MITIIGHASKTNGNIYEAPVNTLTELLNKSGEEYIFIRHYFTPDASQVYQRQTITQDIAITGSTFARYWKQLQVTRRVLAAQTVDTVVIAANPLNALAALIAQKTNKKITSVVYYSADYSTSRFGKKILDWVYVQLDKWCATRASQVWSVSSRIHAIRTAQHIPKNKNIFLPNTPSILPTLEPKKLVNPTKIKIITLGMIEKQLEFENVFQAMLILKNEDIAVDFTVIGNGSLLDSLKQKVAALELTSQVHFLGHLPHDQALAEIAKSDIGLALYNGKWSFNYYGDSMKCREFFCFALPIMTTDTHSTVEEIEQNKGGYVTSTTPEDIAAGIKLIAAEYTTYSQNSLNIAKKHIGKHQELLTQLSTK